MLKEDITLDGMTVGDAVSILEKNGYSRQQAIEIIRSRYEIRRKWDLSTILTHVSSGVLLLSLFTSGDLDNVLKLMFGGVFVTFLLGYNLLYVVYGREMKNLDGLEKMGLSLGVSFSLVVLLGFILDFTVGITSTSILVTLIIAGEVIWFVKTYVVVED
ncbi:hypothetical protein HS7_15250 [Sulfolobales archaeon HS-7]|nr:hypothetical protein HS7_15250 [Sulfolobales archaeon HS-7]